MSRYLLLFAMLIMLAGCRSSKQASREVLPGTGETELLRPSDKGKGRKAELAQIKKLTENKLSTAGLTANARVKLTGIGKDLGVNGRLFMKRNEVVRISLRVFGMEVGLLEFTPRGVLVVDRFHKQYVRVGYSEVKFLKQAELDFNTLQALFWNELFVPGQPEVSRCVGRFVCGNREGRNVLDVTGTHELDYTFYTSPALDRVEALLVRKSGDHSMSNLICRYSAFEKLGNRLFPLYMDLQAQYGTKKLGLSLDLSDVKLKADGPVETKVSSRYTQRSVEDVLKGLKL